MFRVFDKPWKMIATQIIDKKRRHRAIGERWRTYHAFSTPKNDDSFNEKGHDWKYFTQDWAPAVNHASSSSPWSLLLDIDSLAKKTARRVHTIL
jgi:hypothetical protein